MANISIHQVKEFMEQAYHAGVDNEFYGMSGEFEEAYQSIMDTHNKACEKRDEEARKQRDRV